MAKRFTDNEKWKKQWFRKLPAEMKLFWFYICDNCNIAGIWDVDMEVASFFIGSTLSEESALSYMDKQITVISPSKWLINDFVPFQYVKLTPTNNLHRSVLSLLERSGAGLGQAIPKSGDKVKVKDKVKDKVKVITKRTTNNIDIEPKKRWINPTVEEIKAYCIERKNGIDAQYFFDKNSTIGWKDKNGNHYSDWKAVVRTWESWKKNTSTPHEASKLPPKRPVMIVVIEKMAQGKTNYEIKADLVGIYTEKDIDEAIQRARSGKLE